MKGIEKLELLGDINEEYIRSAEETRRKRPVWKTVLPIAAAFVLIAGAALLIGKSLIKPNAPDHEAQVPAAETAVPATDAPTDAPLVTDPPREAFVELQNVGGIDFEESGGGDQTEWGFTYPMFIYHGRIYSQFGLFDNTSDIMGQKVGRVERFWYDPSLVDESEASEPPVINLADYELTGTEEFSIFEVKGFDPELMLCRRDWNGIKVYLSSERLTLEKGSDFLEDVLHISDEVSLVRYVDIDETDYFDNRLIELGMDEYGEVIRDFVSMLDEGEWVEDTRSISSRFFDPHAAIYGDPQPWDWDFSLSIPLNNGLSADVTVYTDGVVTVNSGVDGYALRIDPEKLAPMKRIVKNGEGVNLGCTRILELETCKSNERFGAYVPKIIPDGHIINLIYIDYDIDYDSGEIRGTNRMRIDYKADSQGYTIYNWFMPIENAETDSDVKYFRERGGKVTELTKLTVDDILTEGSAKNDDLTTYAVVTYCDVCIYIWAPDTRPETVYELLRSIID